MHDYWFLSKHVFNVLLSSALFHYRKAESVFNGNILMREMDNIFLGNAESALNYKCDLIGILFYAMCFIR